MSLDTASVMFLCAAKSRGVDFTRTAMIGRQSLCPDPATLRRVLSVLGVNHNAQEFLRENSYSERFFSLLGAKEITSIDYSSYENASVIHDMNAPVPDDLKERFSVVHDGGTIEHVFNIPQAFKNCMEMVEIGGHFIQVNVANNFLGHGFWQFSPELLFRALSPANGYQIEAVLLHEVVPGGAWYAVSDPDEVHSRVQLRNYVPTYILTIAKRIARAAIFDPPPLQSDYVVHWDGTQTLQQPAVGWRRHLPVSIRQRLKAVLKHVPILADGFKKPYYRRISEDALLRGKLK